LAIFVNTSRGQTLSISKQSDGRLLVQGSAPLDTRYALQESGDLVSWVDLDDEVWGHVSNRVDILATTHRFFRLAPWVEPPPIIIMLLGDSTVADFVSNNSRFNGWGQGMYGYFKENAQVLNFAMPGFSSENFLLSEEHGRMLAIKPNYVLVEFGLIDAFGSTEEQRTTLEEFAANLKTIVETVRGFNGTPILITPQAMRFYEPNGQIQSRYVDRNAVIEEVALELQVHLIDLHRLSVDLLNGLGKSGSEYIWANGTDYLHFSTEGAKVIAGLVVNKLPNSLRPYLVTPAP
jgi:lysophospholipase L1-like esterase